MLRNNTVVATAMDHPGALYSTELGVQVVADSLEILHLLPESSVDLIVTSPPFALLRKKEYGNESQAEYIDWLNRFGQAAHRCLAEHGSLVLDLGGAYRRGVPVRSLYNYRVLIDFVDNLGFHLAQEFFWFNPAKLPSPAEWVNIRKIRATDAVNTVWWFSKTEWPKADVRKVLVPYSDAMSDLLRDPESYYKDGVRPSSHTIGRGFGKDNGGAIPKNLLQISNTASNSLYLRTCRLLDVKSHPARFPPALPEFFVKFLSDEGDTVVDIFSGSNTTGRVAEGLKRRWVSIEMDPGYAALSAVRFMEGLEETEIRQTYADLVAGRHRVLRTGKRFDSLDDVGDGSDPTFDVVLLE